jgi:glycosyltransferase involved in cell wall biosynthesis
MSDVPCRERPVPPVLWSGALEGISGYADEARSFLRLLERAGHRPAAHNIVPHEMDGGLEPAERAMLREQTRRVPAPDAVVVHHHTLSGLGKASALAGRANVARTMFETDRIPDRWVPMLLSRDEVWVPCEHNRESFERSGVPSERLRVLGETVDFDVYRPDVEPLELGAPDEHLLFLSNFDFQERKNWRALLAAWARAFEPNDPVCLVLKTFPLHHKADHIEGRIERELQRAARAAGRSGTAPVHVVAKVLAPAEMARLYATADAYVLPSRGEAWGRPYMEALAMGLPTIGSRWSGNLDFMDDATSWLVDGELVPLPEEHSPYTEDVSGHRWFEVDGDALVAALTDVAGDIEAARQRAAPARASLIRRFGPDALLAALDQALRAVRDRHERLDASGRGCAIRGEFGRTSSLAAVNDHLLAGLERRGRRVIPRRTGARRVDTPHATINHSWPPVFDALGDGATVMILPWELGHPRAEWVELVRKRVDRVVVPSAYVRDGFVAGGMLPGVVEVVPNGVDIEAFRPNGDALELPVSAGCVFLFVGGTILRKGIDVLLHAWSRAFGPDDDVALVIKDFGVATHYAGQTGEEDIRRLAERDDVAPVVYLDEDVAADQLPALYRAADVLVAPYRGEGFCLPVLEAMACGRPVVHTGTGPTAEFSGEAEGWPLPAKRVHVDTGPEQPRLARRGYMQQVDAAVLAETLRAVAADPEERARRGAAGRERALGMTWDAAAGRLEEVLAELESEALPLARHVVPATIEGRSTIVLYAPDWDDEETWRDTLARWAAAIEPSHDATLALAVETPQAEEVGRRIVAAISELGLAADEAPDLVLCPHPADVSGLVATADAVLLDVRQAGAPPPALARRAQHLLHAVDGELAQLAAALPRLADPVATPA